LQILFGIDRSKKSNETFHSGSTWFTITHSFAEYILAHQAWIEKTFLYGLACDEVFMQTLIMKSPFKSKINHGNDGTTQNLRYIDWKRRDKNSPYTLKCPIMKNSKKPVSIHYLPESLTELLIKDLLIPS
jgi:hypothetical protein